MNNPRTVDTKGVLLIHDNRTVGFINAVVMYRVLTRMGRSVSTYCGPREMRPIKTLEFWTKSFDEIEIERGQQAVICCVSFDDRNPRRCLAKLTELQRKSGIRPIVLSHRWPDGYISSECEIIVPPYEIAERYAAQLDRGERELLRLSLIVARQGDPEFISPQEADLADTLQGAIYSRPRESWDALTKKEPTAFVDKLRRKRPPQLSGAAKLKLGDDAYQLYEINPERLSFHSHAPKVIAQKLSSSEGADKLGIGVLEKGKASHVYIVRQGGSRLPSIDWLLKKYHRQFELPKPECWFGPPNAKSLLLERAKLTTKDLPQLEDQLIKFADATFLNRHGERTCDAGLAHMVFQVATEALKSLDLLKEFTSSASPALSFAPKGIAIIVEPSTRTGKLKETLVLRLRINSSAAAAFIFGFSGYNLLKLERLLEGALIGVGTEHSRWLGALNVPTKLRVDTDISHSALEAMPRALAELQEVNLVPMSKARKLGIVSDNSSIVKAFSKASPKGNVVCFRGSETIGPSVPYAVTVAAISGALSVTKGGNSLSILDLFSGSGLSGLLASKVAAQVFCVDSATTGRQVQLHNHEKIIWLKGDFRIAISGERGILNREYDLVCMDPPHSVLVELLFKETRGRKSWMEFIRSRIAPWVIIYQGHSSQIGRGKALQRALSFAYPRSELWQVGGEVITVAGPKIWKSSTFENILESAQTSIRQECLACGWEFSRNSV